MKGEAWRANGEGLSVGAGMAVNREETAFIFSAEIDNDRLAEIKAVAETFCCLQPDRKCIASTNNLI